MAWSNPAPTPPAWYPTITHNQRAGIYYSGQAIGVTLSQSGATSYVVLDGVTGVQVASGSISGTSVTVGTAGTAPFDKYGYWKVEMTGPNSDTNYGTSYHGFTFCFIPTDAHFPANSNSYVDDNLLDFTTYDLATRGMFCVGPERWYINTAQTPTIGHPAIADLSTTVTNEATWYVSNGHTDTARPRTSLVEFPNGSVDSFAMQAASAATVTVYCKDGTVNGSTTYVQVSAGSTSGVKVQVLSPNNTTVVETYDNLGSSAAVVAALAGSSYIRGFDKQGGIPIVQGPTAIGNAYFSGVSQVASSLTGVTWFEGPSNEPTAAGPELAQQTLLMAAAVKAGNPSAKVLGPGLVSFDSTRLASLASFFAAGGGNYLDGFSFHGYNCNNLGDLHLARREFQALVAVLTQYGQQNKPRWQTECLVFNAVYGVRHPRRAVTWQALMVLLLDQYSVPKEQTHFWYDTSHGFWGEPAFWKTGDASLSPGVVWYRTLSAEVFGKTYSSSLSFGPVGDDIYLGNIYADGPGNKTVVLIAASPLSNGQAVLTLTGTPPATVSLVDTWGNTSTLTVNAGKVTVPLTDGMPHYLRLTSAVAGVSVASWGSFTQLSDANNPSLISRNVGYNGQMGYTVTGTATGMTALNDDVRHNAYDNSGRDSGPYIDSTNTIPGYVQMDFPNPVRLDHVVVFCPPPWSLRSTLTGFTVQTSPDGTTWTTRYTYTSATIGSVTSHGESSNGWGTLYDSWWDEQHIWDITFTTVDHVAHLRIYVTGASYGGEPNSACNALGQGNTTPQICIAGVSAWCDDNFHTNYVPVH